MTVKPCNYKLDEICDELQARRLEALAGLIRARRASGLTQSQLAAEIGVAQSVISRIESGRRNVSIDTLLKIAEALGGTVSIQIV